MEMLSFFLCQARPFFVLVTKLNWKEEKQTFSAASRVPCLVAQLEEVAAPYIRAGRHVAVVPNDPTWTINNSQPLHKDMNALIAATAWQKLLKLDAFDADALREFIDRYEGIDHHRRP